MTKTTKPTPNSSGHVTPRRIVSVPDELWLPLQDLAALRHEAAATLVREAIRNLLAEARKSGELAKTKRRVA